MRSSTRRAGKLASNQRAITDSGMPERREISARRLHRDRPEADADPVAALAAAADDVGLRADAPVERHGLGVDHAHRLLQPEAQAEFDPRGQQRRRHARRRVGRQAEAGAFPDQRAADRHAPGQVAEMLVGHDPPDRGHDPHRTAMAALGVLPDDVERVQPIVFVDLPAVLIYSNLPVQPILELRCPIPEHRFGKKRIERQLVSVDEADHGGLTFILGEAINPRSKLTKADRALLQYLGNAPEGTMIPLASASATAWVTFSAPSLWRAESM